MCRNLQNTIRSHYNSTEMRVLFFLSDVIGSSLLFINTKFLSRVFQEMPLRACLPMFYDTGKFAQHIKMHLFLLSLLIYEMKTSYQNSIDQYLIRRSKCPIMKNKDNNSRSLLFNLLYMYRHD